MTVSSRIPLGSDTKPFTAMSIMKLVEEGKVGLNDTIAEHVDDFLQRTENTTLLELWQGNPFINQITVF